MQIFKAAKMYLAQSTETEQESFLMRLAAHSGHTRACVGPIGCLKRCILQLGWDVNSTGQVWVNALVQLNLRQHSWKHILKWIIWTKDQEILQTSSVRKAWQTMPPVCSNSTKVILAQYQPHEQHQLIGEIAGAFQTAALQAEWDPNVTAACRFCGEHDDRQHRLYQCAETQHIRDTYQEELRYFRDLENDIAELPVMYRHPNLEWLTTFNWMPAIPPLSEDLKQQLAPAIQGQQQLTFYTDGSCAYPNEPLWRYATFAVILDLAADDEERREWASRYRKLGEKPLSYLPIVHSQCSGPQSIHRAELEALVYVVEHFTNTIIHTDSQCNLQLAHTCQSLQHPQTLHMHPEADLALRLWKAIPVGHRSFLKVDAHKLHEEDAPMLQTYFRLGNDRADAEANRAPHHLVPPVTKTAQCIQTTQAEYRTKLRKIYDMYLLFFKHRAKVDDKQFQPDRTTSAAAYATFFGRVETTSSATAMDRSASPS